MRHVCKLTGVGVSEKSKMAATNRKCIRIKRLSNLSESSGWHAAKMYVISNLFPVIGYHLDLPLPRRWAVLALVQSNIVWPRKHGFSSWNCVAIQCVWKQIYRNNASRVIHVGAIQRVGGCWWPGEHVLHPDAAVTFWPSISFVPLRKLCSAH